MIQYYKEVVSLGGGCDIASTLNYCRIRKQSGVFDWLWNLNLGLENVYSIIQDNFIEFLDEQNYYYDKNARFGDKLVLMHKKYPQLVFLHQNPLERKKDAEALSRRAKRFLNILNSRGKVLFVYYRLMDNDENKENFQELLVSESLNFASKLNNLYPKLKFDLLSLYMDETLDNKRFKDIKIKSTLSKSYRIFFDSVLLRSDENEEKQAITKKRWIDILFKYIFRNPINIFFNSP